MDRAAWAASAAPASIRSASAASTSHAIVEEAPARRRSGPSACTPWPAELCRAVGGDAGSAAREARERSRSALPPASGHAAGRDRRCARRADRGEPQRLALVAKDAKSLAKGIEQALKRLRDKPAPALVAAQRRLLRQRAGRRQARLPVPRRRLAVHEHAGRSRALLRRSAAVARLLALASTTRRAATTAPTSPSLMPARTTRRAASASTRDCTTWTSAARRCSSAGMAMQRCCARSASSPT